MNPIRTALVAVALFPFAAEANDAPAPADAAPATTGDGIAGLSARDPASDRAYFARTGLVAPAGTVSLEVRVPLFPTALARASYNPTDFLEVGVTGGGLVPVLGGHIKLQLIRTETVAVAASVDGMHLWLEEGGDMVIGALNGSVCADGPACRTLVSVHLNGVTFRPRNVDIDDVYFAPGASLVTGLGRRNKLVGELHYGRMSNSFDAHYFGGFGGIRFPRKRATWDVGVALLGQNDNGAVAAYPFPFFGMSARR